MSRGMISGPSHGLLHAVMSRFRPCSVNQEPQQICMASDHLTEHVDKHYGMIRDVSM